MTDKELRRLSRADLVEIIYEVRKNEAELQKEIEDLRKQLEEKQRKASKAGSLAELSASVNGLFESAQATADQYLQEIAAAYEYARKLKSDSERRASAVAARALQERKELLEQTKEECRRMREEYRGTRNEYRGTREEARIAPEDFPELEESFIDDEQIDDVNIDDEQMNAAPRRKVPQDTITYRKPQSAAHRKSARPATMNDRRKMQ